MVELVIASGNTSIEVDRLTREFVEWCKAQAKASGVKVVSAKMSALVEYYFGHEGDPKGLILTGWHGTGRWGDTAVIFVLSNKGVELILDDFLGAKAEQVPFRNNKAIMTVEYLVAYEKFLDAARKAFPKMLTK